MLATQDTHSSCYECNEEMSLFLNKEQPHSSQAQGSRHNNNQRIVSLSDEIVLIKGTLSVAF